MQPYNHAFTYNHKKIIKGYMFQTLIKVSQGKNLLKKLCYDIKKSI